MEKIAHYTIKSELGRGGMGVVYKGHEQSLNRYVAIKVLAKSLADDEQVVERFLREAKAIARLNHPNIVQIYYAGEDEGMPFFAMEYVQGLTLADLIRSDAPMSSRRAAEWLLQMARGLGKAHQQGIIHRDIKPSNVLINEEGIAKLTDFGIALAEEAGEKLTVTGQFVGTPGYVSPEVCLGKDVDYRSDIFSLGVVLYEMLTGNMPFTDTSPLEMMQEVVQARIPDISPVNPYVDAAMSKILHKMIQSEADNRYDSCEALCEDLERGLTEGLFNEQLVDREQVERSEAPTDAGIKPPPLVSAQTVLTPPGAREVKAARDSSIAVARDVPQAQKKSGNGVAAIAVMLAILTVFAGGGWLAYQKWFAGPVGEQLAGKASVAEAGAGDNRNDDDEQVPSPKLAMAEKHAAVTDKPTPSNHVADKASDGDAVKPETVTAQASNKPVSASKPAGLSKEERLEKLAALSRIRIAEGQPRAIVLVLGDRGLAGHLASQIHQQWVDTGIELLDSDYLGDPASYLRSTGWDLAALAEDGLADELDLAILVRVDYQGEQTLNYYGRSSQLVSDFVELKVVSLADRRSLGGSWTTQVDYTTLNAITKAEETVTQMLPALQKAIAKLKPQA